MQFLRAESQSNDITGRNLSHVTPRAPVNATDSQRARTMPYHHRGSVMWVWIVVVVVVVPSLPDNGGRLEALATSEPGWFGLRTVGVGVEWGVALCLMLDSHAICTHTESRDKYNTTAADSLGNGLYLSIRDYVHLSIRNYVHL